MRGPLHNIQSEKIHHLAAGSWVACLNLPHLRRIPCPIRLPQKGNQMIKTFAWLEHQQPTGGNQQPTPVRDTILKTCKSLQCIFPFCHIQVNDILVIHVEHCSQSAVQKWQWANNFGTVTFLLVCIENGNTNNGPTGRSHPISLAKSVRLAGSTSWGKDKYPRPSPICNRIRQNAILAKANSVVQ